MALTRTWHTGMRRWVRLYKSEIHENNTVANFIHRAHYAGSDCDGPCRRAIIPVLGLRFALRLLGLSH